MGEGSLSSTLPSSCLREKIKLKFEVGEPRRRKGLVTPSATSPLPPPFFFPARDPPNLWRSDRDTVGRIQYNYSTLIEIMSL